MIESELHPRLWYVTFFAILSSIFSGFLWLPIATRPSAERCRPGP